MEMKLESEQVRCDGSVNVQNWRGGFGWQCYNVWD